MANWVIRCSEDYFYPIIEYLHMELLKRDIIHCDETPFQVLKENGKKPQTKLYMWLYRSGNDGEAPIVLYDYRSSRSGDHAKQYLKDFKGMIQCDGYSGYNKVSDVTRCACLAHIRRKFVDAIPDNKSPHTALTKAETGRNYCNQLFMIEEKIESLSPKERYNKRLELEKPVLEAFWSWLDSLSVLPGSALGKAVTYTKNQKQYMENYLLDRRCSISNNIALYLGYYNPHLLKIPI